MKLLDRLSRRNLRLASGLVLFTYLGLHLLNHALGLVSLGVAEAALRVVVALWHSLPGTALLYGAAATHVSLALLAVYERRTLRMPALQALRIVLGLWMPVVLIAHFTGSRIAFERYGLASDYSRIVAALWTPEGQGRQLALLAPGWIHGCLGLRFAFSGKAWYRRAHLLLFGAALLLPVLAGLGFLSMGRELAHAQALPHAVVAALPSGGQALELARARDDVLAAYFAVIALVFVAREARSLVERRRRVLVAISYPKRTVRVPRGWTVLEASRSFGIAHLSLCGGRARCSTCRVRVLAGAEHCPPPATDEQQVLERMRADDDVRLACQLRPRGDISVVPMLAAESSLWRGAQTPPPTIERQVAIVVADFRRSPESASSHRSAHDTVYALNLFFEAFGDAVTAADGTPCGFAGHGAVAVFGLRTDLRSACVQALQAMSQVERVAQRLNTQLATSLGAAGELALAAHAGSAVIGQLGHRDAKTLTAVGPAVEVARRLRDYAQTHGLGCAISQALLEGAGAGCTASAWREVDLGEDRGVLRVCAASKVAQRDGDAHAPPPAPAPYDTRTPDAGR